MFQSMYNIVTANIVDMYNYVGSDILRTLYVSYLRYVLVHCRRSVSPKITMSVYKINILENLV